MTNSATCIEEVTAISVASVVLPRCAITIAPPCSAALPTIATITTAMKNSFKPTARPKWSSECTSVSETNAVATVATASSSSDFRSDQAPRRGLLRSAARWMPQVAHRDHDVGEQQHDRDRDREQVEAVPLGRPFHAGPTATMSSSATEPSTAASCQRSERASTLPSPPAIIAAPSTSRIFETTEPVSEPRTTAGSPRDGEERDDQLGRVAEARVEEAADARPVCSAACSVASPISQASGISAIARARTAASRSTWRR